VWWVAPTPGAQGLFLEAVILDYLPLFSVLYSFRNPFSVFLLITWDRIDPELLLISPHCSRVPPHSLPNGTGSIWSSSPNLTTWEWIDQELLPVLHHLRMDRSKVAPRTSLNPPWLTNEVDQLMTNLCRYVLSRGEGYRIRISVVPLFSSVSWSSVDPPRKT